MVHNDPEVMLKSWMGMVRCSKKRNFWSLIFFGIVWSLWFERNKVKFHNKQPIESQIWHGLQFRIEEWVKCFIKDWSFSNLNLCKALIEL